MKIPKEKGQGLFEYAVILGLIAIVVICVMRILSPVATVTTQDETNQVLLSDVPTVNRFEAINPTLLSPSQIRPGNISTEVPAYHCIVVNPPSGMTIKVGTRYPQVEQIVISYDDLARVKICNNVPGADILVYIAYVDLPQ